MSRLFQSGMMSQRRLRRNLRCQCEFNKLSYQFAENSSNAGQFEKPKDIAIMNGFGYVVDFGNNGIQKFKILRD